MDVAEAGTKKRTQSRIALVAIPMLLAGALAWTFVKRPLEVPARQVPALPAASHSVQVGLSLLPTAEVQSHHGLSVRGGSLLEPMTSALVAFVVEHPEGRLLIDAGMGRRGQEHVLAVPWLMQLFIDLEMTQPTVDALAAHGVEPEDLLGIVLTHAHWDHVSGLADLPGVPVFMSAEELTAARSSEGDPLFHEIGAAEPVDVHTFDFDDGPYGPFAMSHDFFDDDSVVLVPMPGHSSGSIGIFVNLSSGRRFLFIGDTAWTQEGVDWPAEKPWLAGMMADADAAGVREQLVLLHQLQERHPDLTIVPAHDARVHTQIAIWPERNE